MNAPVDVTQATFKNEVIEADTPVLVADLAALYRGRFRLEEAQLGGVRSFGVGERVTLHLEPERLFAFDTAGALQAAPDRPASSSSSVSVSA